MVNVLADFPLSVTTKKQLSAFWASSRLPFAVFTLAPTTGALLVENVLNDEELHSLWLTEVEGMRTRIQKMRQILKDELSRALPNQDFSYR